MHWLTRSVQFFNTAIGCSCIPPMSSRILYFKAPIVSGLSANTYPSRHCTNNSPVAPRWPNDISSVAYNAIFKNRAQNIVCSFSYVVRSAVLLKPNVANILLFNFCEQKFVQYGPIVIAIEYNGLYFLIVEEKLPNYASGQKSTPNGDTFWLRRLFNVCVRVFCDSNAPILLLCLPVKIKMTFIWKDFFFLPKSASSVNRSLAIFPSIVQAYTQPYSFGGWIQLIIYQIGHKLSVTIHEISTSWKKAFDDGFYIKT